MLNEKQLLNRLRLRLTGVYLATALGLIILLAGLSIVLLRFHFQSAIDDALRNRLALEYLQLGAPLPAELERSYLEWARLRLPAPASSDDKKREPEEEDEDEAKHGEEDAHERASNSVSALPSGAPIEDLVSVFVLRLDGAGRVLVPSAMLPPGFAPNLEAIAAAGRSGADWRTVQTPAGEPVRLLTYALRQEDQTIYLQAGRSLIGQDRVMRQFLIGLLAGGGALAGLAALVSWITAGRAIQPIQAAWARQREFVANASHELRAPLSLIQLSAELATRPDTPADERQELAGDVLRESRHMARLVSDLLLLSRADAGHLPVRIEAVPVQQVLDSLAGEWRRACAARGVTFEAPPTTAVAQADEGYLRQVLLAVLDNALRYTPAGGRIAVLVASRERWVDIAVSDSGPGIAPEHLPRVFERFYQADAARSDKEHAGLGLSIVRTLVEAMGGHVRLDSPAGGGLTVTISLPKA
ncbi:MAG: sensor histidine kinase [Chloroflexi bacterium]|nr:MAG: sensor histidine kinase [Chloroflexota bacterium]